MHFALARLLGSRSSYTAHTIKGDIDARLPRETLSVFFDVGAHFGESIDSIKANFPQALIYSFEPNPASYVTLQHNAEGKAKALNIGLGAANGVLRFDNRSSHTTMQRVAADQSNTLLPAVEIKTLTSACAELGVSRIDYLKIDTEGHDLEVLRGAAGLLSNASIGIIETECGANCDNAHHISLFEIQSFLEGYGYRLFGIYEQVPEWPTGAPNLRRVNAVYISPAVIKRNTGQEWQVVLKGSSFKARRRIGRRWEYREPTVLELADHEARSA